MQRGVDSYFTPGKSNPVKRNRANSSPEATGQVAKRIGGDKEEMEREMKPLFEKLEKSLLEKIDAKLDNVASKMDIEKLMVALEAMRTENEQLKSKVVQLESTCQELKKRVIDYEDRSRRNNIIFRGLQYSVKNVDYREVVKTFCKNYLGTKEELSVNRAHGLGKQMDNGPIIAHIPDDEAIQFVLKNSHKLRGTNYIIQRDFSRETRENRSILFNIRKEIRRVKPEVRVFVTHDRLIVQDTAFTWNAECGLCIGEQEGAGKLRQILGDGCARVEARIREIREGTLSSGESGILNNVKN